MAPGPDGKRTSREGDGGIRPFHQGGSRSSGYGERNRVKAKRKAPAYDNGSHISTPNLHRRMYT